MIQTREPAVAGMFYPEQAGALKASLTQLLIEAARAPAVAKGDGENGPPKAIIVPHAGYIYSGPTAALAYAALRGARKTIRRVVLLGPVHRVPVRGLALPGCARFATALGEIVIDQAAIAAIRHLPQVADSVAAHAHEHALEVQLPFLQQVLDDFTLLPLAVGDASADEVAQVLELLWGGAGDADRHQLRPVPFPALRAGPGRRPGDHTTDPGPTPHPEPRTSLRRYSRQRPAAGSAATWTAAASARSVQFGRHRRRQAAGGRLRVLRVQRRAGHCRTADGAW